MTKKKWDSFSDKKKKRITLQIYPPSLLYQEEEKAEMDEDSSKLLFEAEAETLKFYKDLVSHPQEKTLKWLQPLQSFTKFYLNEM